MKMLINLVFLVGLFGFFGVEAKAEQCNVGAYAQSDGTIKQKPSCWIKVKNTSGQSLSSGAVLVPDSSADDGVSATTASVVGQRVMCVLMETVADDAFGKCQTYGYHSGVQFAGSGASFTVGTDESATADREMYVTEHFDGKVQGLSGAALEAVNDGATARQVVPFGVFLDSTTSTTTVEAFIQIR